MRRNLDALSTELYNAVSNWNDFTENENGENILTEAEASDYAYSAYQDIVSRLTAEGLI